MQLGGRMLQARSMQLPPERCMVINLGVQAHEHGLWVFVVWVPGVPAPETTPGPARQVQFNGHRLTKLLPLGNCVTNKVGLGM